MPNKYTLDGRLKFLALQFWREYVSLFNQTCALLICFCGFSCQGKKIDKVKIPQYVKEVKFLRVMQYSKELWRRTEVKRLNYSVTLLLQNRKQHNYVDVFVTVKASSRSGVSSQTDTTAVFTMAGITRLLWKAHWYLLASFIIYSLEMIDFATL